MRHSRGQAGGSGGADTGGSGASPVPGLYLPQGAGPDEDAPPRAASGTAADQTGGLPSAGELGRLPERSGRAVAPHHRRARPGGGGDLFR